MLAKADMEVDKVASELAKFGVEAAYVVPTPTGLSKSIMDAHEHLRNFLKSKGLHDFMSQKQGPNNKRRIPVKLVTPELTIELDLSLYRPNTKNGDPRLWISDFKKYAEPFNLIAFIAGSNGDLYAINCSRSEVWNSRLIAGSPLNALLAKLEKSDVASELLEKLTEVSTMGYVDSLRAGPTGVGYTLETLLGIVANSSRNPDYKGIELKSGRVPSSGRQQTRSTLFSKIPNWELSQMKSGSEILQSFGYLNEQKNRLQLYCSISNQPNSQGLQLRIDVSGKHIEAIVVRQPDSEDSVVLWVLSEVQSALALKHGETFWIKAHQRVANGREQFRFSEVTHTRSPLVSNLGLLIDSGKIELDFTLSEKIGGGTRDHGYLFKIWRENFDLLFPKPINYVLSV
jgi:hypothetical protein